MQPIGRATSGYSSTIINLDQPGTPPGFSIDPLIDM
jgi:hypothetical protein